MDGVCKQFGLYVCLKCEKVDEPQTVQHVKNIGVMLQCEECDLWRLLYSKRKLSIRETEIQSFLDDIAYTCGATLEELNLPEKFSCIYIREHSCSDTVEKLYYSAGYAPICIYCAEEDVRTVMSTTLYVHMSM